MTDLPELIANVYRACGYYIELPRVYSNGEVWFAPSVNPPKFSGLVGLDAFVRDIVPTLKERGWHWNYIGEFLDDQWLVTLQRKDMVHACSGDTPVEACFRAAWEALKDE